MIRPRILMYAHDGRGIGHVSRICVLARATRSYWKECEVIVASGARELVSLAPESVECVKLPSYLTDDRGGGHFHTLSPTLTVHRDNITAARSSILLSIVRDLEPNILLTDFSPQGKRSELLPTLEHLRGRHTPSLRVLCFRAVVDERCRALDDSWSQENIRTIKDFYHAILVLGRREVFDFDKQYGCCAMGLPQIVYANLVSGSAALCRHPPQDANLDQNEKHLLVSFGSGYRADHAALVLAHALNHIDREDLPAWITVVLGPRVGITPEEYSGYLIPVVKARTVVKTFVNDMPQKYIAATHFVGYAGNNTVSEVLSAQIPALLIARNQSEAEQEALLSTLRRYTDLMASRETELSVDELSADLAKLLRKSSLEVDALCQPDDGQAAILAVQSLWNKAVCSGTGKPCEVLSE